MPAPFASGATTSPGADEDGGFVCRAAPNDEGAAIVRQAVEDAAERGAEPLRVLGDEFRIGLAQFPQRRHFPPSGTRRASGPRPETAGPARSPRRPALAG